MSATLLSTVILYTVAMCILSFFDTYRGVGDTPDRSSREPPNQLGSLDGAQPLGTVHELTCLQHTCSCFLSMRKCTLGCAVIIASHSYAVCIIL